MSGYSTGYGTGTSYSNLLSQLQANPAQQQVLPGWRHVPGVGTLPMGNGMQTPPILPPPDLGGGGVGYGGGGMGGGGMGGGGTGFIFNKPQGQPTPPNLMGGPNPGGIMGSPAPNNSGVIPQGGPLGRFGNFMGSMDPRQRMALGMGLGMMRGGLGI